MILTITKVLGNAMKVENFIVSLSLGSDEELKPTTTWLGAVFKARNNYELFKGKK
jgi:hypothetical protein